MNEGCRSPINIKTVFIFILPLIYTVTIVPAPLLGIFESLSSGPMNPFQSHALVLFDPSTSHIEPAYGELCLCISLLSCHFVPESSPAVVFLHSISIPIIGTHIFLTLQVSSLGSLEPPLMSLGMIFCGSLPKIIGIGSIYL